ncbi:MAG TPA: hypothetical protein VF290_14215 [Pyrinomonadaceae bacterium]
MASLLTATTRVMVVGMGADLTAVQATSDVAATAPGIAIVTLTTADGVAVIAIGIVTSTMTAGVVAATGKASQEIGSVP